MLENATFALGATSFEFKKEIPLMAKFIVTTSLLGFDKKWVSRCCPPTSSRKVISLILVFFILRQLYIQSRFHSPPHPKTGAVTTYALVLSHLVLKHNRRTISPHRAFALAGYGKGGQENWEIVKTMSAKEKLQWLVEEGEGAKKGEKITVGQVELGMEERGSWPGQLTRD